MDIYRIAKSINKLGDFLGKRDIDTLTSNALEEKYHIPKSDMLILFGSSIPYAFDIVGKAILDNIAENFMIVGGEGSF